MSVPLHFVGQGRRRGRRRHPAADPPRDRGRVPADRDSRVHRGRRHARSASTTPSTSADLTLPEGVTPSASRRRRSSRCCRRPSRPSLPKAPRPPKAGRPRAAPAATLAQRRRQDEGRGLTWPPNLDTNRMTSNRRQCMADRRYETLVLIHPEQGEPGCEGAGRPHPDAHRGAGRDREPGTGVGSARARLSRRQAAAGVLRAVRVSRHAEGAAGDRAQPHPDGPGPAIHLGPPGGERAARRRCATRAGRSARSRGRGRRAARATSACRRTGR